jgi:hypothetical protein
MLRNLKQDADQKCKKQISAVQYHLPNVNNLFFSKLPKGLLLLQEK